MPLYQFACPQCSAEFEELVRMDETVFCPSCGGAEAERLLGVTAAPRSELPLADVCPPSDAPPCRPNCCRIP